VTWGYLKRRTEHVPLRVVAHVTEPILYAGDGLHLDGILSAAAFEALDERTRRRMPPLSSPWAVDIDVPLARWGVDVGPDWSGDARLLWKQKGGGASRNRYSRTLWGWCASAVQAEWQQHGTAEIRKRPELDQMRRYAKDRTADISSGPMKAYDLAFPTVFAPTLTWYALGDGARVLELLRRHIVAIGKKTRLGYGTVARWEVERVEADWSIAGPDGRLVRRMPRESGMVGQHSYGAIRPPYHHASRLVECVEPQGA
jgi:CRISPR type IV-associated protein Csf3